MIGFIFLLIFIATSVISYYRIQTGFALVVACRLLIPSVARINLVVVEVSLNSCFILMLLGILLLNTITGKIKLPPLSKTVLRPILFFLAALLVITFFADKLTLAQRIGSLIQFIYTEVTLGVIAWVIFNQEKEITLFYKIIAGTVLLIGLYGLYCYVTLTNPYVSLMNLIYSPKINALGFMEEKRAGIAGRIQGTMLHPLIWGGACMLLFYFMLLPVKKFPRYIGIALLVLLFINVVFSGSRAALLALLMGIGYFFVISNIRLKLRFVAYALTLFSMLTALIYLVPSFNKYEAFFESTIFFWDDTYQKTGAIRGSTSSLRINQLYGSFDMIESAPIFGLGQGYTAFYSATYGIHPILAGFESVVFMALIETGIVGLLVWTSFFISLFWLIRHLRKKIKPSSPFDAMLLRTFLAAYCVFIVFTGIQSTFYIFLVLFLIQLKNLIVKNNPVRRTLRPATRLSPVQHPF